MDEKIGRVAFTRYRTGLDWTGYGQHDSADTWFGRYMEDTIRIRCRVASGVPVLLVLGVKMVHG